MGMANLSLRASIGAILLCAEFGQAATLSVSPVRVFLSPQESRGIINLRNPESSPILVQAQGFLWSQEDGNDTLGPTEDLIVVPPVMTLAPNGEQIIRIGFRDPPAAHQELSYRVLISEVPDRSAPTQGVSLLVQLSLPIFFTPPGAAAEPEWAAVDIGSGQELRVTCENSGSAHIRVTGLAIYPVSEDSEPMAETTTVSYVLPQSRMSWTFTLDRREPAPVESVVLRAETNRGVLRETLAVSR
jgi:fimbrial chaperone protein